MNERSTQVTKTGEGPPEPNLADWPLTLWLAPDGDDLWAGEATTFPIYWNAPAGDESEVINYEKYAAQKPLGQAGQ